MPAKIDDQYLSSCCFLQWMRLQEQGHSELLQAISTQNPENGLLSQLTQKTIKQFEDYMDSRIGLGRSDISAYFAANWCTSLEKGLLWIGGCRPSIYFRLIYALSGEKMEFQLSEGTSSGTSSSTSSRNFSNISHSQLVLFDNLRTKTIKEEEKLTNKLASFQEEVADQPFALIAQKMKEFGDTNEELEKALDGHEKEMVKAMDEADKLRLSTLKELIQILTPFQAVEFLAASKKLHLCVHEWGKKRDYVHGR